MNTISISLLAGITLALPTMAAVDITKLPPATKQTGVTYAKDIRGIFETSCFRCHGAEKQKGELRLDTLDAALEGGKDGKVIVAGKSSESPLVIAVARLDEKHAMPPKPREGRGRPGAPAGQRSAPPAAAPGGAGGRGPGPAAKPLTPEQVGLIRAWIDQGAK
jgi:mono/diheme cytochrome c family protein